MIAGIILIWRHGNGCEDYYGYGDNIENGCGGVYGDGCRNGCVHDYKSDYRNDYGYDFRYDDVNDYGVELWDWMRRSDSEADEWD